MSRFLPLRIGAGLLTAASMALPAEPGVARELNWTHFGLRPLAMGNAYVAVADDFNALFYNPAGLARLKTWDGEFLNPTLEISKNTIDTFSKIKTLAQGASGGVDSVLELLEENTGKSQHFALGLTPHLVFPGFGFGLGIATPLTMAIHRDISVDLEFGPRAIVPISVAGNFLEDRLSLGATLKLVVAGGVDHEFSINDISAFSKNDSSSSGPKLSDYVQGGAGVGFDFGLLFTPIKTMSPTLGVSVTDLGGTPYQKQINVGGTALGTPKIRLPSVNTGLSLIPWEAGGMYLRTSVDAHAINQPDHFSKKFNLGAEWGYGSILKVQTGVHQGELSAGFEFDVMLLAIRFVTYSEQLGVVAGEDDNLRDRRYAVQIKAIL
jgi:hypothetical protein